MGWLTWIIVGLVAGALAKLVMPGKDPGGIFITILLGIAGGLLGGYLGRMLGIGDGVSGFNLASLFTAMVGAIILLLIYRMFKKK